MTLDGRCLGSYFDGSLQQSPSSSGDRTEEQVRGGLYFNSCMTLVPDKSSNMCADVGL